MLQEVLLLPVLVILFISYLAQINRVSVPMCCARRLYITHGYDLWCILQNSFYFVWPKMSDCAHKLIMKVFTEIKSESSFPINFYRTEVFLQPQLSPSGGLQTECRFLGASLLAQSFWLECYILVLYYLLLLNAVYEHSTLTILALADNLVV